MHALFENIMKGFLKVWKPPDAKRKGPDGSTLPDEPFVLSKDDWKAMAEQIASSNSKVPSTMASRIHDLDNRGFWTAESYSYFAMFLGPIVLKDRLADEYYDNFLRFSYLVRALTVLEIPLNSLHDLEREIGEWVMELERCVVPRCSVWMRKNSSRIVALDSITSTRTRIFPSAQHPSTACFMWSRTFAGPDLPAIHGVSRWSALAVG